jgi:CheY-like chemotaxis protein
MSNRRGHCRVLIIEADPLSRGALVALLEHLGCTCFAARSHQQALDLLASQTHVIASVDNAELIGFDVLKVIRERGMPHHIGVMTALERDHDLVRAVMRLEPELLLRKPVEVESLIRWLDHSR